MTEEEKQGLLKNICASDEEIEKHMNKVTNDSIQVKYDQTKENVNMDKEMKVNVSNHVYEILSKVAEHRHFPVDMLVTVILNTYANHIEWLNDVNFC